MSILLGCIADDFTGGTDLAGMLVKYGMRTVQMIGVPKMPVPDGIDAVVLALKSRTNPVDEAIAQSLEALRWLQQQGCRQFYFKYCSTFDSTAKGNIGPVAEALMAALGSDFTIACPAFPANHRTVYQGNLFVGPLPLNETGMRNHPLTPMTDSNLVRVLQAQTKRKVDLVDYATVSQGAAAIAERFQALRQAGGGLAIADAVTNRDLFELGSACADLPLITGGSGLAIGLPANFQKQGLLDKDHKATALPETEGLRAVIAGSCSVATQGQVAAMGARHPAFNINPLALARGEDLVGQALDWASGHLSTEPVLIYATARPEDVKIIQDQLGVEQAGGMVEAALAAIACGLVELGVGKLVVAGGETSGAVVKALGVSGLRIGPEIDPGVPWTVALQETNRRPLALALKSGNFGTPDFFLKAWSYLA